MITLNGNQPPESPNDLDENPNKVKTDTFAIDGTPQRLQFPSKKAAKLTYIMASAATYQFYKALYDAAAPVTYLNDQSNVSGGTLSFTGIIDFNEDAYIRGANLVPLVITISEGGVTGS